MRFLFCPVAISNVLVVENAGQVLYRLQESLN